MANKDTTIYKVMFMEWVIIPHRNPSENRYLYQTYKTVQTFL